MRVKFVIFAKTGWPTEPETGTVGTFFPRAKSGTGTAGTSFQEPKPEPEPCLSVKTQLKYRETLSQEEPSEPQTGTARTVPCTNRNRTEPNRGHPAKIRYFSNYSSVIILRQRISLFKAFRGYNAKKIRWHFECFQLFFLVLSGCRRGKDRKSLVFGWLSLLFFVLEENCIPTDQDEQARSQECTYVYVTCLWGRFLGKPGLGRIGVSRVAKALAIYRILAKHRNPENRREIYCQFSPNIIKTNTSPTCAYRGFSGPPGKCRNSLENLKV